MIKISNIYYLDQNKRLDLDNYFDSNEIKRIFLYLFKSSNNLKQAVSRITTQNSEKNTIFNGDSFKNKKTSKF